MAKFKPKVNDQLYLLKENRPLNLAKNDIYGSIKEVTKEKYIVERFDGELIDYSIANQDEVFFLWFSNKSQAQRKAEKSKKKEELKIKFDPLEK